MSLHGRWPARNNVPAVDPSVEADAGACSDDDSFSSMSASRQVKSRLLSSTIKIDLNFKTMKCIKGTLAKYIAQTSSIISLQTFP
jgi:hypothetical protein